MKSNIFRTILAVVAGIVLAVLIFMLFEKVNEHLYPIPSHIDSANHEAMSAHVSSLPVASLAILLLGWAIGSLICGLLVGLLVRNAGTTPAYIAGLFLMSAGIVDIFMFPRPVWFAIGGMIVFIPATLLGSALVRRR